MPRRDRRGDLLELVEQVLVNLEPTGGVDEDDVRVDPSGLRQGLSRNRDRIFAARRKGRRVDALCQHFQLLHRRRAANIG